MKTYIEVLPYPKPFAKWQKDTKISKPLSVPSNNSRFIQVVDIGKNRLQMVCIVEKAIKVSMCQLLV